ICPASAFSIPISTLARVDFPPPLGPVMTSISPFSTVKLISFTMLLSTPFSFTLKVRFFTSSIFLISFLLLHIQVQSFRFPCLAHQFPVFSRRNAGALPEPLHKVAHIVEPTGKTDRCDTVIRCFQLPHGLSDPIAVQITLRALP